MTKPTASRTVRAQARCIWSIGAKAILLLAAAGAAATPLVVHQGSDLSVTAGPGGDLVFDLAGRLWRIPADGGDAVAITPPGEFARRPVFSPDGTALVYQSMREGAFQVIVADADGGHARPITEGPWDNVSPAWSPDGRRVAVASNRSGDFSIWTIEIDTGRAQQVSFEPGHELDPAWDPTGTAIAYVSDQPGRSSLVVRGPFPKPRTLASNGRLLRAPSWRPDGSVITYTARGTDGTRLEMVILSEPPVVKTLARGETLFPAPVSWKDRTRMIYTADGGIRQRDFGAPASAEIPFQAQLEVPLVRQTPARHLAAADATEPAVGLAGIAVLANHHLIVSALGDLWEFTADGTLVRKLTNDEYVDRDPDVSADGRHLAFTSDRSGSAQVWLMNLATGDQRRLTNETGFAMHPAWSAQGDRIAFIAGGGGAPGLQLRVAMTETGKTSDVADGVGAPTTPVWSPDSAWLGLVQRQQGVALLLLFAADGQASARRVTLPENVVGAGANEAQWAPDGRELLIASAAGIRALPALDGGMVGADWRTISDSPVQIARWIPGTESVLFADSAGLARAGASGVTERIALPLSWRPATPSGRTIIRGARVFDSESGGYLTGQDIVIEGNRIVSVGPDAPASDADRTIDATGRTVLPGLIDLSLQITDVSGERLGRTLLAYGITTAQATAAASAELREVAERWRAHAAGPRLLRSSEWCTDAAMPGDDSPVLASGAMRLCPAALGRLGDISARLKEVPATVWSLSWIAALAGAADAIGPFGAPVPAPTFEALGGHWLYQDAVDAITQSGTLLVTGLAAQGLPLILAANPDLLESRQFRSLGSGSLSEFTLAAHGEDRVWLRDAQRLLGRLAAGGGRLAPASASPASPYGLGFHAELRLLAGSGLGRAQVLRMATAEAARALGLQEELGRVAPGRLADLLIIEGDPLADLRQLLNIEAVMVDGRVRAVGELLAPPTAALENFTPPEQAAP